MHNNFSEEHKAIFLVLSNYQEKLVRKKYSLCNSGTNWRIRILEIPQEFSLNFIMKHTRLKKLAHKIFEPARGERVNTEDLLSKIIHRDLKRVCFVYFPLFICACSSTILNEAIDTNQIYWSTSQCKKHPGLQSIMVAKLGTQDSEMHEWNRNFFETYRARKGYGIAVLAGEVLSSNNADQYVIFSSVVGYFKIIFYPQLPAPIQ